MLYRYLPYRSDLNRKADDILAIDHLDGNPLANYFIVEPNTEYLLSSLAANLFPEPAQGGDGSWWFVRLRYKPQDFQIILGEATPGYTPGSVVPGGQGGWHPQFLPTGGQVGSVTTAHGTGDASCVVMTIVGKSKEDVTQFLSKAILQTQASENSFYFSRETGFPGHLIAVSEKETFANSTAAFPDSNASNGGLDIKLVDASKIIYARFKVRPQHLQYSYLWDRDSVDTGNATYLTAAGNAVKGAARIRGDVIFSNGGVYYDSPLIIGGLSGRGPEWAEGDVGVGTGMYTWADIRPKGKLAGINPVGTNPMPQKAGRSSYFQHTYLKNPDMCDMQGDFSFLSGNFTMEFWMQHHANTIANTANPSYRYAYYILFDTTSPAQANAFRMYFDGDLYPVLAYNTQTFKLTQQVQSQVRSSTLTYADGQGPWFHVAISKNGDAIHTHINGVSAGVFTVTSPALTYFQNTKVRWLGNGRSSNGLGLPGLTVPGGTVAQRTPVAIKDLHFWSIPKYSGNFTPSYPVLWTGVGA